MDRVMGRLLAAALLWLAAGTGAQADNAFEVRGIAVDVTGSAAAAAREKALVEGERKAFQILLRRLTLAADRNSLPDPAVKEISALVKDFEVAEEKASSVRYIAKLNYRFKPEGVRALLQQQGLAFTETFSKPLLVLPVYQTADTVVLFDDPNPWRDAWNARPSTGGLLPTVVPLGDLADMATIDARQAITGDAGRLGALAPRYGAGEAVVARAVFSMGPARNRPQVVVALSRPGGPSSEKVPARTFVAEEKEDANALLARVAMTLTDELEDGWKQGHILKFGEEEVMSVIVPIHGLKDWVAVRQRLEGATVIRQMELVLLSVDEARLILHYMGTPDQLVNTLSQSDLSLARQGDEWILTSAGQASAPAR